jgi:4-alpha-glucanotransferase
MSKPTIRTEAELWRFLEKAWKVAAESDAVRFGVELTIWAKISDELWTRGLCGSISNLRHAKMISLKLRKRAEKRMALNMPKNVIKPYWFWWLRNNKGARSRARFCAKMAAQCSRKARAAK